VHTGFGGESERKRPLGRLRHRWEDSMKLDLQEVGCDVMDWIDLAQDRDKRQAVINVVMSLLVT